MPLHTSLSPPPLPLPRPTLVQVPSALQPTSRLPEPTALRFLLCPVSLGSTQNKVVSCTLAWALSSQNSTQSSRALFVLWVSNGGAGCPVRPPQLKSTLKHSPNPNHTRTGRFGASHLDQFHKKRGTGEPGLGPGCSTQTHGPTKRACLQTET